MTGAATIVIGLVIYLPYRLGASRRARTAWTAAMEAGATPQRRAADGAAGGATPERR